MLVQWLKVGHGGLVPLAALFPSYVTVSDGEGTELVTVDFFK